MSNILGMAFFAKDKNEATGQKVSEDSEFFFSLMGRGKAIGSVGPDCQCEIG